MSNRNVCLIGKITKIVNDGGIKYGFIKVSKIGDIFFSLKTLYKNIDFESLKINDSVHIAMIKTDRGLFAKNMSPTMTIK